MRPGAGVGGDARERVASPAPDGVEGIDCLALADGSHVVAARSDQEFSIGDETVPGSSPSVVLARISDAGQALWSRRTVGDGGIVGVVGNSSAVALVLRYSAETGFESTQPSAGSDDIFAALLAL